MIKPKDVGLNFDNAKNADIEHAKLRLEKFIDECLVNRKLENNIMHIGLLSDRDKYRSNEPNQSITTYNYYKDVLEPVCEEYKKSGWYVYCQKFYSFLHRDDLYFSATPQPKLISGYNIEWDNKSNPIKVIENKSNFYIPSFETKESADKYFKERASKK